MSEYIGAFFLLIFFPTLALMLIVYGIVLIFNSFKDVFKFFKK